MRLKWGKFIFNFIFLYIHCTSHSFANELPKGSWEIHLWFLNLYVSVPSPDYTVFKYKKYFFCKITIFIHTATACMSAFNMLNTFLIFLKLATQNKLKCTQNEINKVTYHFILFFFSHLIMLGNYFPHEFLCILIFSH